MKNKTSRKYKAYSKKKHTAKYISRKSLSHRILGKLSNLRLMPLILVGAVVIFLIFLSMVTPTSGSASPIGNEQTDTQILFAVNGHPITVAQWHAAVQNEFTKRVEAMQYENGTADDNTAINMGAMHDIVDSFAIPVILQRYKLTNTQTNIVNAVIPDPSVGDSELLQFYQTNPNLFANAATQVHVREIVVGNMQDGQAVLDLLKKGMPFEQIARSSTNKDPDFYKLRSGDMGWLTLGSLGSAPPIWATFALQLKPGQISPIFQVDGEHYYILQAVDAPDYEPISFEDHKDIILAAYNATFKQAAFGKLLATIERGFTISQVDNSFQSIVDEFEGQL